MSWAKDLVRFVYIHGMALPTLAPSRPITCVLTIRSIHHRHSTLSRRLEHFHQFSSTPRLHAAFAAGFLALASAKELAQNVLCGDNVSCTNQCNEGRYHFVSGTDGTGSYFGCAQAGTKNYRDVQCGIATDNEIGSHNDEATPQACGASSGKLYVKKYPDETVATCVILSDQLETFDQACKAFDSKLALNDSGGSEDLTNEEASKEAGCNAA